MPFAKALNNPATDRLWEEKSFKPHGIPDDVRALSLDNGVVWPCKVRISSRARRYKLSVQVQGDTELVLPQKYATATAEVDELLHNMRPWLQRTLQKNFADTLPLLAERLWRQYCNTPYAENAELLPSHIHCPILEKTWHIEHNPRSDLSEVRVKETLSSHAPHAPHGTQDGTLCVTFPDTELDVACYALQRWLLAKAKPILQAKTLHMAQELGLEVHQVRIRLQRARWGSCSSKKNINLNARLLLLPPELLEHVILHELCHLVHLNHSPQFWQLLTRLSPHTEQYEEDLHTAWKELPAWALAQGIGTS